MYSMDCVVYFSVRFDVLCTFVGIIFLLFWLYSMNPSVDRAFQTHSFNAAAFQAPLETRGGSFYLMFYIRGFVNSSTASDLKEHALKGEHYKSGLSSLKANWATNLSKQLVNWGRCSTVVPVGLLKAITCSTVLLLRWFPAHVIEPSTLSSLCEQIVCSATDEATLPFGKQSCVKY